MKRNKGAAHSADDHPTPENNPAPQFTDSRLVRYDDARGDLTIPIDGWPQKFPLCFQGVFRIGSVEINWREFFIRFFSALFSQSIDSGERTRTDAEIEALLDQLLMKENSQYLLHPAMLTLEYVMLYAPQKLNDALADLLAEAHQHVANHELSDANGDVPAIAKFTNSIASRESHRIERRMKSTGDRLKSKRGQHSKWTRESLIKALSGAIEVLMKRRGKAPITNKGLLELVTAELKKTHGSAAPKNWDSLRKLISSLEIGPEWENQKSRWRASRFPRSGK